MLSLAVLLAIAGCGTASPTAPDTSTTSLLAAPATVTLDGVSFTMTAGLNRDFMPIIPPGGHPMTGFATVTTTNGSVVPTTVTVDAFWAVNGSTMWAATPSSVAFSDTGKEELLVRVTGGPQWTPGILVDIIVELRGSTGTKLLHVTGVLITSSS
jgi:hypothetical protein